MFCAIGKTMDSVVKLFSIPVRLRLNEAMDQKADNQCGAAEHNLIRVAADGHS